MPDLRQGPGAGHQLARLRAAKPADRRRERARSTRRGAGHGPARPSPSAPRPPPRAGAAISPERALHAAGRGRACCEVLEEDHDAQGNLKQGAGGVGTLRRKRHRAGQPGARARASAASRTSWSSTTRPITPTAFAGPKPMTRRTTLRRGGGQPRSSSRRRPSGWTAWTASTSCAASTSAWTCRPRPISWAASARTPTGPFPWVVSDFGLTDAIESGLVKIPQLAVRDTTGAEIPGYFNIWRWILPRLTPAERGGRSGNAEARGDPQVGQHARSPCWRRYGTSCAGNGSSARRRPAPAGVHPGVQEHRASPR